MTSNRIEFMTRKQVRDLAGKLMEEWQNVDAVADVLGCQRAATFAVGMSNTGAERPKKIIMAKSPDGPQN